MITSICLLAGFSSRMGQPKQHVNLGGKSFLERIIESLEKNSGFLDKMIFVGQISDRSSQELVKKHNGLWLVNENPQQGQLSSIKIALQHVDKPSSILLWPVDHPMISSETVRQLCQAATADPTKIVVPSIDNRRGHPSIFPAITKKYFAKIPENEGARKILQLFPDQIKHVLTDDIWVRKNLNTPEILAEAAKFLEKSKN